jgi:sulfotransferase family protein
VDQVGFVIIAGSNKCGTTSLFRYLADHPAVRPSNRKELLFFSSTPSGPQESTVAAYCREFSAAKRHAPVLLEASPQYLHAGRRRAENIRKYLPEARLLFILRDPVQRLVSYYRSDFGQRGRPSYGYSFARVVELGLDGLTRGAVEYTAAASFAQEIRMADYVTYLQQYLEVWPRDQMRVIFFEDFCRDLKTQTADVARFLDLDVRFYDDYVFEIENRTRGHRSAQLQRLALLVNRLAESLLISRHGLKRRLRRAYDRLNSLPLQVPVEPCALEELRGHYQPSVVRLREWMRENYPQHSLPSWLLER